MPQTASAQRGRPNASVFPETVRGPCAAYPEAREIGQIEQHEYVAAEVEQVDVGQHVFESDHFGGGTLTLRHAPVICRCESMGSHKGVLKQARASAPYHTHSMVGFLSRCSLIFWSCTPSVSGADELNHL